MWVEVEKCAEYPTTSQVFEYWSSEYWSSIGPSSSTVNSSSTIEPYGSPIVLHEPPFEHDVSPIT